MKSHWANPEKTAVIITRDGVPGYYDAGPYFAAAVAYGPDPMPPLVCTPRQARLAMIATPYGLGNLLQAVQAAVAASNNTALQIAWEYGTQWERNDPNIAALASALDLSPAQVDNLFVLAMTL